MQEMPPPSRKRISIKKIAVIIIVAIAIFGLVVYQQITIISLLNHNQDLELSLTQKQNELAQKQKELEEYRGALKVPYAAIIESNVTWVFKTSDGNIVNWYVPLDTYNYYINKPKPTEYHLLTIGEQTFKVRQMELFVQPEFFAQVISSLTKGNTAEDFVREVFNLRVQLTLYSSDITDTPQWSVETMTKGTGDCEDFAILMASLLVAGNNYASYGMTVKMVYMDAENPTNPQTVNHASLLVNYRDGTGQFVESTSSVMSPWSEVVGWYFDI
jgi:hypothetical protein